VSVELEVVGSNLISLVLLWLHWRDDGQVDRALKTVGVGTVSGGSLMRVVRLEGGYGSRGYDHVLCEYLPSWVTF
jgi:hypothetical protein